MVRMDPDWLRDATPGLSISAFVVQPRRSADTVYRRLIGEKEWSAVEPPDKGADGVVKDLTHFIACAETGAPCRVDGREGRCAMEMVLASYQSARRGARVTLPLDRG